MAQPLQAFWTGPKLGQVHVACLKSMVRVGHSVTLHCYESPEDTPDGVLLSDAAEVLPRSRYFVDRKYNYPAIFSDLFRYALMRKIGCTYVDCDVYCLKAIPEMDYIFSWESSRLINGAVLKLPADSPLLSDLWRAANNPYFIPPWLPVRDRWKLEIKRLFGRHDILRLRRSTFGPRALTYYATKRGMAHLALPSEVFYPVKVRDWGRLFDPTVTLADIVKPETIAIHLYSSQPAKHGIDEIPKGSVIAELIATQSYCADAIVL